MIGMAIIISFSATMHVYLLKKKAIRAYRYEPTYGEAPASDPSDRFLEGNGTVKGEVIAVSFDKFFLRVDGNVQPFAVGQLAMPDAGKSITVYYTGGRPPTALEIHPGDYVPTEPAPPKQ